MSESAICSSSGVAEEDSLEEQEECLPPGEVCYKNSVKKLGSLCRCEDPKSVGGGRVSEAGLEPLSCEKEVGLQGTPEDGHGAEASGQICL